MCGRPRPNSGLSSHSFSNVLGLLQMAFLVAGKELEPLAEA